MSLTKTLTSFTFYLTFPQIFCDSDNSTDDNKR